MRVVAPPEAMIDTLPLSHPLDSAAAVRGWIASFPYVSRETWVRLERYFALLAEGNQRQNLVAASTLAPDIFWTRHIADSAQLLSFSTEMGAKGGRWVDLGSGPGLPGLIIAIVSPHWHVTLVESRRLRCDFLRDAIVELGLDSRVTVAESQVQTLPTDSYDVISARAFAPIVRLLDMSAHLAGKNSLWLLPKGRNAAKELSSLPKPWQDMFHVKPSLTDGEAGIMVGRGIVKRSPPTKR